MKSVLAAVLIASGAGSAVAHPTDEDYLYQVGVGSTIELTRDINVLPAQWRVQIGGAQGIDCYLHMNEASLRVRVLAAKTKWTVETTRRGSTRRADRILAGGIQTYLLVNSDVISGISCLRAPEGFVGVYRPATIGQFKEATKDLLRLEFAPPTVVSETRPIDYARLDRIRAALSSTASREKLWP